VAVGILVHGAGGLVVLVAVYVIVYFGVNFVSSRRAQKRDLDVGVHVGVAETHTVHCSYNAYKGLVHITVDGARVEVDGVPVPKWGPTAQREYRVTVGQVEKHTVTLMKTQTFPFGSRRPQAIVAYIDGVELPPSATQPLPSATP
jgi:hypothetical protein